jgi:DNA-directed RNA polymerase alpha subunit
MSDEEFEKTETVVAALRQDIEGEEHMSISAMKQALDALENSHAYLPVKTGIEREVDQAITALRQAIAEAEKQEQKTPLKVLNLTVFTENRLRNGRVYDVETLQAMTNRDILAIPDMGKKALKEVLEALDAYASDISQERVDETAKCGHEWVGLDDDIPGLGLVTEEFYNGMLCAEDILRKRNT